MNERIHQLHRAFDGPGEELGARSASPAPGSACTPTWTRARPVRRRGTGRRLRERLDARVVDGLTAAAVGALHATPAHLVRASSRMLGTTPARYAASGSAGKPVDAPL